MLNIVYVNCEGCFIENQWESLEEFVAEMNSDNSDIPMLDDFIQTIDCDECEELDNKNYEDFYTVDSLLEYVKNKLSSRGRLESIIINAIHKVFNESVCDFSKWWQDEFETDYGFDTEEELKGFPEDTLECVKYDWIAWTLDGFVTHTLLELGINEDIKTKSQTVLIEVIHDIVKDELMKKIEAEWK